MNSFYRLLQEYMEAKDISRSKDVDAVKFASWVDKTFWVAVSWKVAPRRTPDLTPK